LSAMNDSDVLWDVIEVHLDEAAYVWTKWERALVAPNCTLKDVIRGPEERLLAHIDGLVVAGEPAVERLLVPALEGEEPEKVFAAALALLDGPVPDAVKRVFARLEGATPEIAAVITRALELAHRSEMVKELVQATRSEDGAKVAAALSALSALAVRRVVVPGLAVFLESSDPAIRAPALKAARVGGQENWGRIEAAFAAEVTAVRDAALETGLVLGMPSAWTVCRRIVDQKRLDAAFPLLALATSGEDGDLKRILAVLEVEGLRPAVVEALGYTGRVAAVDACIPLLADGKLAKLAGEAVSAITGLEIDGEYLKKPAAEQEEPRPLEEEDLDADIVPGPEELLPEPEAAAVEKWWKEARARFGPKVRYIGGKSWSDEALAAAFAQSSMRRRRVLGIEVAIRSQGEQDVETRGWAKAWSPSKGRGGASLNPA
jgi:uncharacterized protein (TIGR02270 family)